MQTRGQRLFRVWAIAVACTLLSVNVRAQTSAASLSDREVDLRRRWIEGEFTRWATA